MSRPTAFKANNWIDVKTGKPSYGIDAFVNGQWVHCCEGSEPYLVPSAKVRNRKLEELRASL